MSFLMSSRTAASANRPHSLGLATTVAIVATFALSACSGGSSGSPGSQAVGSESPVDDSVDNNLTVAQCDGSESNPERLFLQQVGTDRAIIKWRGNQAGGDTASEICFGTDQNALPLSSKTSATVTQTDHSEVLLTGLTPDTLYYYSIGGASQAQDLRHFRTAPLTGNEPADGNTRIWVIGDSGTAGSSIDPGGAAEGVRDGYLTWVANNGGEPADLLLMLGDAAYLDGTDAQFQASVFETYPDILSRMAMWNTIGNHEMGGGGLTTSTSTDVYAPLQGTPDTGVGNSPMPYLNIYTFPTQGENGGVPSNTEQYYSFDYGNVHVVSLDSQVTIRDESNNETMKQWLIDDLSANSNDWTVVIFHHPPYTKGSHDSDSNAGSIDQPIFDIREQYTPIFEDHGVDLVYSGHSHSYERSFYLNGHTGLEADFNPLVHAENDGVNALSGQGADAYHQVSAGSGADDKVVYTVAGSSGQATSTSENYPHNAMAHSDILLGSVVIDANDTQLTARFIDVNGDQLDHFIINR